MIDAKFKEHAIETLAKTIGQIRAGCCDKTTAQFYDMWDNGLIRFVSHEPIPTTIREGWEPFKNECRAQARELLGIKDNNDKEKYAISNDNKRISV